MLTINHLSVEQQGRTLLKDISFTLAPGEMITIVGPNGSGKTTLLKALLGLMPITSGEVVLSPEARIGYMPQRIHIDPTLPITVKRFLQLKHHALDEALLKRLGVIGLMETALQHLSGGEMQRVLLARALSRKPNLLVLDEPVQGVDINGQAQLYGLIAEMCEASGASVLMVSHDLHMVMAKTDAVICLNQHICCHGTPEVITKDPAFIQLFGDAARNMAIYTHAHDHSHDEVPDV